MDAKQVIQLGLAQVNRSIDQKLEGLTPAEFAWQPRPEANSIALILFHMARSEDSFVQSWIRRQPKLWEAGKWYEKLQKPKDDNGGHYTAEEVAAFSVPLEELKGYAAAVRRNTLEFVQELTPGRLDEKLEPPPSNAPRRMSFEPTVGYLLMMTIIHLAEHAGEISYLRGLQRGMNK